MAVVTLKSGPITNRDATPRVLNNGRLSGAPLLQICGTVAAANGDSIASKYIFGQLPSNAVVSRVLLGCDAVTSGAGDIGLYRTTADGGAVVDVDLFASAQSIASALLANTDVSHEAGAAFGVEDVELPLWQVLGLSADPCIFYDVVMTLTAATTAAGDVSLKVQYTV